MGVFVVSSGSIMYRIVAEDIMHHIKLLYLQSSSIFQLFH